MSELNLAGEIDWPAQRQAPGRLDFAVNRPGRTNRVSADLVRNRAAVQQIQINSWGVLHVLHTFSGTRINNPTAARDWPLTTIWVVAMDALSAGLLLMVLSSYYMWYRLKPKRRWGAISLAAGVVACGFFAVGLAWVR
jgi:hypothetical protein